MVTEKQAFKLNYLLIEIPYVIPTIDDTSTTFKTLPQNSDLCTFVVMDY